MVAGPEEQVNTEELRKNIGQRFRLHPLPVEVVGYLPEVGLLTSDGPKPKKQTIDADYDWLLEDVTGDGVVLRCTFKGYRVVLRNAYVREHHQPNVLMLRCHLTLEGDQVFVRPT